MGLNLTLPGLQHPANVMQDTMLHNNQEQSFNETPLGMPFNNAPEIVEHDVEVHASPVDYITQTIQNAQAQNGQMQNGQAQNGSVQNGPTQNAQAQNGQVQNGQQTITNEYIKNMHGPRITVIGVGGGGGNAVKNMMTAGLTGVNFIVANTDAQALAETNCENVIQLGLELTEGLGAGSKPQVGEQAAESSKEEILAAISDSNMVFVTAGMGGGTGTGAAPVVARIAKEKGILTLAVVTKPFDFEGRLRMNMAEEGITKLSRYVDTMIVIPNQNLLPLADENTKLTESLARSDDVLYQGVSGITDLMLVPGYINLDFNDIRTAMLEMGTAVLGTGEAEGSDRAERAATSAMENPLLDNISIKGARSLLVNITSSDDVGILEIEKAVGLITKEVHPDAAIIYGQSLRSDMGARLRISMVAAGIDQEDEYYNPLLAELETQHQANMKNATLQQSARAQTPLTSNPLTPTPHTITNNSFAHNNPNVMPQVPQPQQIPQQQQQQQMGQVQGQGQQQQQPLRNQFNTPQMNTSQNQNEDMPQTRNFIQSPTSVQQANRPEFFNNTNNQNAMHSMANGNNNNNNTNNFHSRILQSQQMGQAQQMQPQQQQPNTMQQQQPIQQQQMSENRPFASANSTLQSQQPQIQDTRETFNQSLGMGDHNISQDKKQEMESLLDNNINTYQAQPQPQLHRVDNTQNIIMDTPPEPPKKSTLFSKIWGGNKSHNQDPIPQQPQPQQQPMISHPTAQPTHNPHHAGNTAMVKQVESVSMASPSDPNLDIPAFLRRQAN